MEPRKQMKGRDINNLRFLLTHGSKVVGICKKGWYMVRRKLKI
jgi:hypothetical protein